MIHPPAKYTTPLTRGEVNALVKLAQAGSKKAKNKLVLSHYRFLVRCAGRYVGRGVNVEDLVSEGMIGLIRSVDTFDLSKNIAFSSYAVWWIFHSMTTLIHNQSLTVRVPANMFVRGKGPNQTYQRKGILLESDRKAKNKERIERNDAVIRAIRFSPRLHLMDDFGPAFISPEPSPDTTSKDFLNKKRIDQILSILPAQEAEILRRYYGVGADDNETLQSIGDSMSFSKEYIRQLHKKAVTTLKHNFGKEEE